ncbi:hypothetical protein PENSPDRAFT_351040 [Peniophora sp. CONT]|nr:hypothetical protein PENSPDRAFT_351040 [Peniophora sp. CONT]
MPDATNLPIDVICEVFEHAALTDPPKRIVSGIDLVAEHVQLARGYDLGWILLTHTCRRWRTIGLNMASLWADIVMVFRNPVVAEELVLRARECGLTLQVDGCYQERTPRQQLWFDWAMQYVHRARILHCFYPQDINHVDAALRIALHGHSLPTLTSVDIQGDFLQYDRDAFALELVAPALLVANLLNVLPSPTSTLQNLRELNLQFAVELNQEDLSGIVALLQEVPKVETLTLLVARYDPVSSQQLSFHGRVQLDYLKRIEITSGALDADLTCNLLEYISTPCAEVVRVDTCSADVPSQRLLGDVLQQYFPRLPFDSLFISTDKLTFKTAGLAFKSSTTPTFTVTFKPLNSESYAELLTSLDMCAPDVLLHIQQCELSLSSDPRRGHVEHAEITARTTDAVDRLGQALVDATLLVLPLRLLDQSMLHLLVQQAISFFPSLATLRIDTSNGDFEDWKDGAQLWWDAMREALTLRTKAGSTLQRLEMVGTRLSEDWESAWRVRAEECRALGLVQKIVDGRSSTLTYS